MDIITLALPMYNEYLQAQQHTGCRITELKDIIEVKVEKGSRVIVEKDNKTISVYPIGKSVYRVTLPDGQGEYTVKVVDVLGNELYSQKIIANMKLTSSSTMINYDKLYKYNLNSREEITKFVKDLDYSTETYEEEDYIPNLEDVVKRKYGICVDYAALYCAFCRMNNIECRMVYGYRDNEYHAWCEEKQKDGKYKLVDLLSDKKHKYKPVYYY